MRIRSRLRAAVASVLLVGMLVARLFSADFHPFAGPKPLAVLLRTDPWLLVGGSDTPQGVIYENGDLVYAKEVRGKAEYRMKRLAKTELRELLSSMDTDRDFAQLRSRYEIYPQYTDQPTTYIYFAGNGTAHAVAVCGEVGQRRIHTPAVFRKTNQRPQSIPSAFSQVHEIMTGLSFDDDIKWQPKYIEVMLSPYEYAPNSSIQWPVDFPDLESDRAVRRGECFSIFLDQKNTDELTAFLRTRKERGAVVIDGKKWSIEWRAVFPSEPIWRRAFGLIRGG